MFKKKPIFPGTSDVDQAQKIFLCVWLPLLRVACSDSSPCSMCGSPNEHSMPGWSKLPGCEGINSWSPCQRRIASEYQECVLPFSASRLELTGHCRYGEDFVDLMEHLLVLDPRKRLTAVEALDHKWFWIEPYPTDPKLWALPCLSRDPALTHVAVCRSSPPLTSSIEGSARSSSNQRTLHLSLAPTHLSTTPINPVPRSVKHLLTDVRLTEHRLRTEGPRASRASRCDSTWGRIPFRLLRSVDRRLGSRS